MAPLTAPTEYVLLLPDATEVLPEITPGCAGNEQVLTVTANVLAALAPHELFAVTEIVPPALPAVVVIEVEVDEPDHPEGSVHV